MVITRNSIHVQRHAILFAYFRKEPFKNAFLLKALVNISSLKKSASWKFQNINSQLSRNVIIENFIKFQTLFISFDNFFLFQILKRYKKFKTKILFLLINDILPTFESPKALLLDFSVHRGEGPYRNCLVPQIRTCNVACINSDSKITESLHFIKFICGYIDKHIEVLMKTTITLNLI